MKIAEQKKYTEKLMEENKNLAEKFNNLNKENSNIRNKYYSLKDNQEQLVVLVKIIQESGVDVEAIIDKWNNEVEQNENGGGESTTNREEKIEMNKEHEKYEFLPITVDKPKSNVKAIQGIPKLNFKSIKSGNNNQENN